MGEVEADETTGEGRGEEKKDFATMPTDERDRFFRGFHSGALAAGRELVKVYDFSAYRTLADVGGGTGGLVIALSETLPSLRSTGAHPPQVVPPTRRLLAPAR